MGGKSSRLGGLARHRFAFAAAVVLAAISVGCPALAQESGAASTSAPVHGGAAAARSVTWIPSAPEVGDTLTVFFEGFSGVGVVEVALLDADSGARLDQSTVPVSYGFAVLKLPDRGGRYRVALLAGGSPDSKKTLYRSAAFAVDPPAYQLAVPTVVDPGSSFQIQLGRTGGAGDAAQLLPDGDPAATPLVVAPVEGVSAVTMEAPGAPGSYVVEVVSGADGSVLATAALTVGSVGASGTGPGAVSGGSCSEPPDAASLKSAFDDAVQSFLDQARAMYGGTYRNVQYSYQIESADVSRDQGAVVASYSGSVTDIATGKTSASSGTIDAWFQWQNCGWTMTNYSY